MRKHERRQQGIERGEGTWKTSRLFARGGANLPAATILGLVLLGGLAGCAKTPKPEPTLPRDDSAASESPAPPPGMATPPSMLDRAAAGQPVSDPNQPAPSPAEPAPSPAAAPAEEPAAAETSKDASTEPKPAAPAAEAPATEAAQPATAPAAPTAPAPPAAAGPVDVSAFDKAIRPQNDLYEYVNGTWLKETPIPADKSNYGAFIKLDDLSRERIRAIVEQAAAAEAPIGSDARKVGDFHRAFMNTERTASLGYEPIAAILGHINGLGSHDDLAHAFGMGGQFGVASPIGHYVGIDDKDSTRHLTTITQAGTTLPDRDYYFGDGEKENAARAALVAYVNRLAELTGDATATPGETVLALEKQLAGIQWPRVELRDAIKTYNKFAADDFAAKTPNLRWVKFLEAAGTAGITEVNVATPSYFEQLDALFPAIDVAIWKTWLRFKAIDAFAPYLAPDFEAAHFDFHGRKIAGIQEELPRWKRSVEAISGKGAGDFGALGDVVGKLYVKEHFTPEAKARMDLLVKNLLTAFGSSIDELSWMTPETKAKAREKLAKITPKIGYPETWRAYDDLVVQPDDLVGNILRSRKLEHDRNVAKLGKPVDREEWGMTPQTVNAYYNPSLNEIVFPAAILQAPFFSVDAPDALNYGGIGGVIGHEISHAFDDQGSRYDGNGNLENWWTDQDRVAFEGLTKRLVEQYSSYEPLPGRKLKGDFTLGENIADLSGLAVSYKAFQLAKAGKEPEPMQGWTSNQLFFVGWSRVWQRKYREDELVRRLLTDPHSPSRYRANGPVSNLDAFYEAFEVKEGDALWKPEQERIRIW
ncbi:MAG: M13 family metallopeptidase [Planctomycetota bacterium]|nr:M13 family metallopeptidase [Planctomycetota bacterium]